MKKHIPVILCVLFLMGTIIGYALVTSSQNAKLDEQQAEIALLENQIAMLANTYENTQTEILQTTTGLNLGRVAQDDAVLSEFFKTVFTWDTYNEYMDARDAIMHRYGLTEDSQFMSVFMPEVVNRELNGKNYNRIDVDDLNMNYEDFTSYVVRIMADEYSYFTVVDISSTWKNGGESIVRTAITYTVNANGELSNINAVPLVK